MTISELEARVAALEQTVAQLVAHGSSEDRPKDWRSSVGMFADDPVMKEIQAEGQKIREGEREQSHRGAKPDEI